MNELMRLIYTDRLLGKHRAADYIFEWAENLFTAGRFDEIDDVLDKADLGLYSTQMLVNILAVTHLAKDKLSNRDSFIDKCEAKFLRTEGSKRTKGLLSGFRTV